MSWTLKFSGGRGRAVWAKGELERELVGVRVHLLVKLQGLWIFAVGAADRNRSGPKFQYS